jgi:DnaJ-class molecular chaperone
MEEIQIQRKLLKLRPYVNCQTCEGKGFINDAICPECLGERKIIKRTKKNYIEL